MFWYKTAENTDGCLHDLTDISQFGLCVLEGDRLMDLKNNTQCGYMWAIGLRAKLQ